MNAPLQSIYTSVDPVAWVLKMGEVIAKSRMFSCATVEQGQGLALVCLTEQISILECSRRYHVLGDGKLSMKADYMRHHFRELGGKLEWLKDGSDGVAASCRVSFEGQSYEVSYSMDDARKEKLVKADSRWEKAPGDMLRARCSTKAIRMICPTAIAGMVTDEEMEAIAEGSGGNQTPSNRATVGATVGSLTQSKEQQAKNQIVAIPPNTGYANLNETHSPVPKIGAPVFVAVAASCESEPSSLAGDGFADASQREAIQSAFDALALTDEMRGQILGKYGVTVIRSLKREDAATLVGKLKKKLDEQQAVEDRKPSAASSASKSDGSSAATPTVAESIDLNSPAREEDVQRLKERIAKAEQEQPGITSQIINQLKECGFAKFKELSIKQINELHAAIVAKNPASFFGQYFQSATASS